MKLTTEQRVIAEMDRLDREQFTPHGRWLALRNFLNANTADDEGVYICPNCGMSSDYVINRIALRKWGEYQEWKAEWDGDFPAKQEWMTFEDWLQQEDK